MAMADDTLTKPSPLEIAAWLGALGCRVVWLDRGSGQYPADLVPAKVAALKSYLAPYGLGEAVALSSAEQPMYSSSADVIVRSRMAPARTSAAVIAG